MLTLIIREPVLRASMKMWAMRLTRPAVDNFVQNFSKRSDFEYAGTELAGEIHTEKFKMFHEINDLHKFIKIIFETP